LWALFGLFGFTLFQILDNLQIIFTDSESLFLTLLFFINIFNTFIVIALFFLFLLIPKNKARKIITALSNESNILISIAFDVVFIIGVFCNIYVIFFSKHYGLNPVPYYAFGIYDFLYIFSRIFFNKLIFTKDNKIPKVDLGLYYNNKNKNLIKSIYGIIFLILFCFHVLSIYQIIQNDYILNHIDLFKSSIYLNILFASIFLFIRQLVSNMRYEWLEQFERNIILKNLNVEEIENIFINEFIGKDAVQWLKELENEAKEESTVIKKIFSNIKNDFKDLTQEEKDLNKKIIQLELITKRLKELSNRCKTSQIIFIDSNKKLNYFLDQGPVNNEEELLIRKTIEINKKNCQILHDIIPELEDKLNEVERLFNNIKESLMIENN